MLELWLLHSSDEVSHSLHPSFFWAGPSLHLRVSSLRHYCCVDVFLTLVFAMIGTTRCCRTIGSNGCCCGKIALPTEDTVCHIEVYSNGDGGGGCYHVEPSKGVGGHGDRADRKEEEAALDIKIYHNRVGCGRSYDEGFVMALMLVGVSSKFCGSSLALICHWG